MFKLERGDEPVTVKRVAEELGVAPPSVSEMLGGCAPPGWSRRRARRASKLTPEGELEGARLVRRHRLSERFLVDYLGMPWDAVHDEACKFEHVLSPEVEARLAEQLGDPRTCPHGHAIPQADGSLAEEELRPLLELRRRRGRRHRLHRRGEWRLPAVPRLAGPAAGHPGRGGERRAVRRPAARARGRVPVRARARGGREDPREGVAPWRRSSDHGARRTRRRQARRRRAAAARRVRRRQPQRRQDLAVQRAHRRRGGDGQLRRRERRGGVGLHALGRAARGGRRPSGELRARGPRRGPASSRARRCWSGGRTSSWPSPTPRTSPAACICRCSFATSATGSPSPSTSPTRPAAAGASPTRACWREEMGVPVVATVAPRGAGPARAPGRGARSRGHRGGLRGSRSHRGDAAAGGGGGADRRARRGDRRQGRRRAGPARRPFAARRRAGRARGRRAPSPTSSRSSPTASSRLPTTASRWRSPRRGTPRRAGWRRRRRRRCPRPAPTRCGASPRRRAPASPSCSASSPPCSPRCSSSATWSRACSRRRGRRGSRRPSIAAVHAVLGTGVGGPHRPLGRGRRHPRHARRRHPLHPHLLPHPRGDRGLRVHERGRLPQRPRDAPLRAARPRRSCR